MDQLSTEAIKFMFEREQSLNSYWNLLIAVSLGIAGLLASGEKFAGNKTLKRVLSLAFVIFTVSNLFAILSINDQRRALFDIITEPRLNNVALAASPPSDWVVILFHLVLDVAVLLVIWLVPWYSPKEPTKSE